VSGEALPDVTRDERDDHSSDDERDRESWLRDQIPPHHG
jgi:hypothetical protein